jgi:hypothetical protein
MAGQDPLVETTLSEGDFKQRLRRRVRTRPKGLTPLASLAEGVFTNA